MRKERKSKKFGYFFAELFILILGISVSFILNEWRVNKQERDQEIDLLKSFKENLITDSTTLHYGVRQLDSQVVYAQKEIGFNENTLNNEVITQVLSLLNYVPFNSNDITYQEMKTLGSSRIIKNDSLLSDIIG